MTNNISKIYFFIKIVRFFDRFGQNILHYAILSFIVESGW